MKLIVRRAVGALTFLLCREIIFILAKNVFINLDPLFQLYVDIGTTLIVTKTLILELCKWNE